MQVTMFRNAVGFSIDPPIQGGLMTDVTTHNNTSRVVAYTLLDMQQGNAQASLNSCNVLFRELLPLQRLQCPHDHSRQFLLHLEVLVMNRRL